MLGGAGNDWFFVDDLGDTVTEGAGGGTADRVFAGVSWNLTAGAAIETLSTDFHAGTAAINLRGNELGNLIFGNAGSNILVGREGVDTLYGGAGAGNGNDFFLFETAPDAESNFDILPDYKPAEDEMWLLTSAFPGLSAGFLTAAAFFIGPSAHDADDRIIYDGNPSTGGTLWFDPDGIGGADQIRFAVVNAGLAMTENEFRIFAF